MEEIQRIPEEMDNFYQVFISMIKKRKEEVNLYETDPMDLLWHTSVVIRRVVVGRGYRGRWTTFTTRMPKKDKSCVGQ